VGVMVRRLASQAERAVRPCARCKASGLVLVVRLCKVCGGSGCGAKVPAVLTLSDRETSQDVPATSCDRSERVRKAER